MGINTNLNIDPYFDDFDEAKQFNRVLFKPARAVQARELTQLQTILQNQVERFGSNIYKEGTIISGINFEARNDIFYVKLNDQADFPDPTIYEPTDAETYFLVGETSALRAEIVKAENGFQTRNPDLKTFFIKYLNTGSNEVKQFIAGEVLSIRNSNDEQVLSVITASVEGHAGRSHGVATYEGIIYQKGHFIFVEPQFVITEKYSNIPDNVSVGFEVEENLITSNQDQTLLDNAQGYNNENAPGADRLQLRPILKAYDTNLEPDNFFALLRYSAGNAITIRDITEFNSIETEMARRTYEESGNYVVRGMEVSVEQNLEGENANTSLNTYAAIAAGKAYVEGYEVTLQYKRFLPLEPETKTITKANQGIGATYSGYYTYNNTSGQVLEAFALDGTRYSLRDNSDNIIGYCSVANIEPGKIYVYAVEKVAGEENTAIAKISNTPVTSQLIGSKSASMLFDSGKGEVRSLSNVSFTRRFRLSVSPGSNSITIEASEGVSPLISNIVVVDSTAQTMGITNVVKSGNNVVVFVDDTNAEYVYYDAIVTNVESDTLEDVEVYVRTQVVNGTASLGLPNVVKVLDVIDDNGNGSDVTSKFVLANNQKEGFYDISYLQLRTGETLTNSNVRVRMIALRRSSVFGNAYLDATSYQNIDTTLLKPYTNKQGITFNLLGSVDFRPYATPFVNYSFSSSAAPTVTVQTKSLETNIAISNNSTIFSDQEFYLSRIDSVVVNSSGAFNIIKGIPSESPVIAKTTNVFPLSTIFIPGGEKLYTTGQNAIALKNISTRNYTMEDIEGIDQKVNVLTDAVSLSLLELETSSLFIDDGAGNNRFKNGILVDSFKDINVADFNDGEYKAAIDSTNRILSPAIKQFPIDLKIKDGNNVNTGFKDIVTLSDTGSQTSTITQPYATDFRNAVSNFYRYQGSALIYPQFDSAYDVVQNPESNIEIDVATPLLDLVDNIQEFVPLTRSTTRATSATSVSRVAGGRRITTNTTRTTTTRSLESTVNQGTTGTVGNFVTDVSLRPYMRSRQVQVLVTGLRPNTIHHFFFDTDNVDQHMFPADANATLDNNNNPIYDVRRVAGNFRTTNVDISTDANGVLAAVFVIPENTFFVGDTTLEISDVDTYSSIKSGGTSYSKIVYHAYSFGVEKTNVTYSTRSVDFDTTNDVRTTRTVASRFVADPPPPRVQGGDGGDGGGSCFVAGTLVTMADGSEKKIEEVLIGEELLGQDGAINKVIEHDHPMLDERNLVGLNGMGQFMTPEHPVFTREGWKAQNMQDTINTYPHMADLMVGNLAVGDEILRVDGTWMLIESIEVYENEEEQQVFNFILDGNNTYFANGLLVHNRDPLAQTFFIKNSMSESANSLYIHSIDLYFKGRTDSDITMADVTNNGVTIQIREVVNGYPSANILPFGSKHLSPGQVLVSEDSSVATTIVFDNPVRLDVEKEYTFVVEPDAQDPNYLVYTAKVGGTDITSGVPITQDWGDGVLFTSTNNRAWKSYQDEDVKFNLKSYNFSDTSGHVNLVPNDPEFLTVNSVINEFVNDEIVYVNKSDSGSTYSASVSGFNITVNEPSVPFVVGDYAIVSQGSEVFVSKVVDINSSASQTVITVQEPSSLDPNATGAITLKLGVAGKVEYFNRRKADILNLTQSSARTNVRFEVGDTLTGYSSGATATVDTIEDIEVSYFQPMIFVDNTLRSSTNLELYENSTLDKPISMNDDVYVTTNPRKLRSKSRIVDNTLSTPVTDDFTIRLNMSNELYTKTTPVFDEELSIMNVYRYEIEDDTSSSSYVAKEIVLQEDLDATGLKVLLSAYRPIGTYVDVYARFVYPTNGDEQSDWIKLVNSTPDLYSNISNINDYRDYQYDLADETNEFSSFQIKIVMRHATDQELSDQNLNIEKSASLFAHVNDYRAIALT